MHSVSSTQNHLRFFGSCVWHTHFIGHEGHPIEPLSFYGISKHTVEHYIRTYSHLYGLDYTILHYANVYGIRQGPKGEGGVVSIFIDKLLRHEVPIIYGNGEQTRDFIYVKDIVSANMAALDSGSKDIYNVGTNSQTIVNELLSIMCGIFNIPFKPEYKDSRAGDIMHSRLINQQAMDHLQWKPSFTLLQGLTETSGHYIINNQRYSNII